MAVTAKTSTRFGVESIRYFTPKEVDYSTYVIEDSHNLYLIKDDYGVGWYSVGNAPWLSFTMLSMDHYYTTSTVITSFNNVKAMGKSYLDEELNETMYFAYGWFNKDGVERANGDVPYLEAIDDGSGGLGIGANWRVFYGQNGSVVVYIDEYDVDGQYVATKKLINTHGVGIDKALIDTDIPFAYTLALCVQSKYVNDDGETYYAITGAGATYSKYDCHHTITKKLTLDGNDYEVMTADVNDIMTRPDMQFFSYGLKVRHIETVTYQLDSDDEAIVGSDGMQSAHLRCATKSAYAMSPRLKDYFIKSSYPTITVSDYEKTSYMLDKTLCPCDVCEDYECCPECEECEECEECPECPNGGMIVGVIDVYDENNESVIDEFDFMTPVLAQVHQPFYDNNIGKSFESKLALIKYSNNLNEEEYRRVKHALITYIQLRAFEIMQATRDVEPNNYLVYRYQQELSSLIGDSVNKTIDTDKKTRIERWA